MRPQNKGGVGGRESRACLHITRALLTAFWLGPLSGFTVYHPKRRHGLKEVNSTIIPTIVCTIIRSVIYVCISGRKGVYCYAAHLPTSTTRSLPRSSTRQKVLCSCHKHLINIILRKEYKKKSN